MIVLSRKKIEVNDVNFHEFMINGNYGEDFSHFAIFFHEGKKFKAYHSVLTTGGLDRIYRVVGKYMPQTTKHNYDNTNFFQVSSIIREDALTVIMKRSRMRTVITFESAEECLAEYLALKTLHKEASSNEKYFGFKF